MNYKKMRRARINYAVKCYPVPGQLSSQPWALFITGYKCSGKSTFLEELSLEKKSHVHVNADDIRLLMLGGSKNDAALLKTVGKQTPEQTGYKEDVTSLELRSQKPHWR